MRLLENLKRIDVTYILQINVTFWESQIWLLFSGQLPKVKRAMRMAIWST
jgi:hypothetical protein